MHACSFRQLDQTIDAFYSFRNLFFIGSLSNQLYNINANVN